MPPWARLQTSTALCKCRYSGEPCAGCAGGALAAGHGFGGAGPAWGARYILGRPRSSDCRCAGGIAYPFLELKFTDQGLTVREDNPANMKKLPHKCT